MNKHKWKFTAFGLIIVGIIILFLIAFYILPTPLNNRTIDINPHKQISIVLEPFDHQEYIHALDFKLTGELFGSAEFIIGETDSTYVTYRIENEKVNIDLSGDYYMDKFFVTYKPIEIRDGRLKIEYRFYGSTKY